MLAKEIIKTTNVKLNPLDELNEKALSFLAATNLCLITFLISYMRTQDRSFFPFPFFRKIAMS